MLIMFGEKLISKEVWNQTDEEVICEGLDLSLTVKFWWETKAWDVTVISNRGDVLQV